MLPRRKGSGSNGIQAVARVTPTVAQKATNNMNTMMNWQSNGSYVMARGAKNVTSREDFTLLQQQQRQVI